MSPAPARTAHDVSSRALGWVLGAPLPPPPALLTEYTGLVGGDRTTLDTATAHRLPGLETA
ncbi:hypothetical protein ADK86_14885 [Streptomyces sp. NRRL F-5755]|uniref:hypothetical protein n=1 Tax=Streptomyces sp. NRRL F-5755 TaxID=1519475 RepID=UPI0006AE4B5E|nr:hypothetical protein [Streptomyces sp. NRRL F-5755]KOT99806.1 hypothetical protein ADK86_14885 [Streptomyces sp. NRRL F-5755]